MRHKAIIAAIVLAWFVGIRAPHESVHGAFVSMVIGPFKTLAECKREWQFLLNLAEQMEGAVVTDCKEAI
jgi:hypothetical protein